MNLTSKQRNVLLSLTTEWSTPVQIAEQIPEAAGNPSYVNQSLKDLMHEGLVQANPVVLGMYRLTAEGMSIKDLDVNQ